MWCGFAKTFNKKYGSTEEYNKRRAIFLENYNDMVRHNKEYEEGKVSWWRKVTEHYDLTAEEREVALNLGNISHNSHNRYNNNNNDQYRSRCPTQREGDDQLC